MNIGGIEILAGITILKVGLSVIVAAIMKVLATRLWQDKEITLEKVLKLILCFLLIVLAILKFDTLLGWVWGVIQFAIEQFPKMEV